ncbi:hypothetical protein ACIQKB_04315 [Streptomyces sp. NPDC092046]|uniref:hypothetical protein n=1 Tax=Streptomyces sp. NPDC092046 TaxID=3366009 RepID=UPI0038024C4C
MAIELSDDLIQLMRNDVAAREAATSGPYSAEAWQPWLEAATTLHAAITAHAEAAGVNRFDVESALKKLVLHPAPAE